MAIALSLLFDAAMTEAVRAIWVALADAGESRDMIDLGYPPHLTIVVAEDEGLAPLLVRGLAQLASLVPSSLALGEIRQFEGTSVTWISAASDPSGLMRLHAAGAALLPAEAIHPHYRPDSWTPHVTLATNGNPSRLLEASRAAWTPRSGVPTRLEVARFLPAQALAGIDLPAK